LTLEALDSITNSTTDGTLDRWMLLKLEPQQVSEKWSWLKRSLQELVFTTESEEVLTNILQACLSGEMQFWFLMNLKDQRPVAAAITSVTADPVLSRKLCNIYALYTFGEIVPKAAYDKGFKTLRTFARSVGCTYITMYTQDQGVAKLFQSLDNAEIFIYGEIKV